jgi:hypothetical protein
MILRYTEGFVHAFMKALLSYLFELDNWQKLLLLDYHCVSSL